MKICQGGKKSQGKTAHFSSSISFHPLFDYQIKMWLYHWATEQRPVWILLGLAISGPTMKIYNKGGEQEKFMEAEKSTSLSEQDH